MKKGIFIIASVLFVILLVWYVINSDEIAEIKDIKKISLQKASGNFPLSKQQQNKLDNFILDIAEIETRGCSAGAKFFSVKCAFTDKIAIYALGEKNYKNIKDELKKQNSNNYSNKPLFAEINSDDFKELDYSENKIIQQYSEELKQIYKERLENKY